LSIKRKEKEKRKINKRKINKRKMLVLTHIITVTTLKVIDKLNT